MHKVTLTFMYCFWSTFRTSSSTGTSRVSHTPVARIHLLLDRSKTNSSSLHSNNTLSEIFVVDVVDSLLVLLLPAHQKRARVGRLERQEEAVGETIPPIPSPINNDDSQLAACWWFDGQEPTFLWTLSYRLI